MDKTILFTFCYTIYKRGYIVPFVIYMRNLHVMYDNYSYKNKQTKEKTKQNKQKIKISSDCQNKISILRYQLTSQLSIYICSNISAASTYGVYISQLIRYSWSSGFYHDFCDKGWLLKGKLLNQGFLVVNLQSSLRKFYDRHHDLVNLQSSLRKFYDRHHDLVNLQSSLRKLYDRHHDLVNHCGISVSKGPRESYVCCYYNPGLSSFILF